MDRELVLKRFFKGGRLQAIPKKLEGKHQLFAYLQEELATQGQSFTEKEVNAFLRAYYPDYAILRRYLVDFAYLERDTDGREYRLPDRGPRE